MTHLTNEEKLKINRIINKCGCFCHNDNITARHMIPCCAHSTEKKFKFPIDESLNSIQKPQDLNP